MMNRNKNNLKGYKNSYVERNWKTIQMQSRKKRLMDAKYQITTTTKYQKISKRKTELTRNKL